MRTPDPDVWANALVEIIALGSEQRQALADRAKDRARALFGMEAMADGIEAALQEAAKMGEVESSVGVWLVMLMGFVVAYTVTRLYL